MLSSAGVKLPGTKSHSNSGRHCPIWRCCPSSIIRKKAKTSDTGLCSGAWMANLSYWIRPATCLPISARISMLCSPNGLLRSKMHNNNAPNAAHQMGQFYINGDIYLVIAAYCSSDKFSARRPGSISSCSKSPVARYLRRVLRKVLRRWENAVVTRSANNFS